MEHPFNYRNKLQYPVGIKNGEPVLGVFAERTHEIIPTTNAIEFSNDQRPAELLYDQLENPLKAGDVVNADVSIWGYNGKVNIEVLKADIIDNNAINPGVNPTTTNINANLVEKALKDEKGKINVSNLEDKSSALNIPIFLIPAQ